MQQLHANLQDEHSALQRHSELHRLKVRLSFNSLASDVSRLFHVCLLFSSANSGKSNHALVFLSRLMSRGDHCVAAANHARRYLIVRRPVREVHFVVCSTGRLANVCSMVSEGGAVQHLHSPKKGGGSSCSPFSTGPCSPNFDQGDIAPTMSVHCFLFALHVRLVCTDLRGLYAVESKLRLLLQMNKLLEEKDEHISHLQERVFTLEQRVQDVGLSEDERIKAVETEVSYNRTELQNCRRL